ncbi:hypothetical protein BG60_33050 [Caballeronia zhejiangensis]|uniref:Glycosyl transferase family 1 domain-containing protein n=1 Tax=Caballeronia zhejiangensis TaxID=871203 RepID=A0A656QQ13_9BURK|nr:hypothetical protein BG60_33050 [Caballeronia zhejiangensis]
MNPNLREAFDAKFYLETYADVAASGMDPWEHYVQYGRAEGRVGSAGELSAKEAESFDADFYLASNPDVAAAAVDPYEHYVLFGKAEGRKGTREQPVTEGSENPEKQRAAQSGVADFDPDFYLEAAPDVAASGMSALDHYLLYGRAEGRASHPLDVASQWRGDRFGSARPKVIVVSHDASRTGAPVVALNICQQLSARADVIAILLADGPLTEEFRQVCCETLVLTEPEMRHAVVLTRLVRDIRARVTVDHAIVNSTESRMMVKPLADHGMRVLFLVHEYVSYMHSRTSTDEAINHASVVVMSSQPVLEDAINDETRKALERAVLLRQGKSVIPQGGAESSESASRLRGGIDERKGAPDTVDHVKTLLNSIMPRPRLVLGAGTVQFRKGVDLFFAAGAALRRHAPDDNTLFVWVGHDSESDLSYTACLTMQMRALERAGGHAHLFGATSRLEELYELADVFFLSSRMDPLPNVAIDAMTVGLPVLCFEGAGGIAEVLADSTHADASIAPFSDVAEVARRLDALAREPELRKNISVENRRIARNAFDMNAYVERLVSLLWAETLTTI